MRRLHILVVSAAAVAALALPSTAAATQTYLDTVTGVEIYATSTEGTFVGTANGDLPGSWEATIDHTVLSPSAVITGGSFSLSTAIGSIPTLVTGDVTGGTVTRLNPNATGCVNQYFGIDALLGGIGIGFSGTGTGEFTGLLTHYRKSIWGYCVTYAASVGGQFSLSF